MQCNNLNVNCIYYNLFVNDLADINKITLYVNLCYVFYHLLMIYNTIHV